MNKKKARGKKTRVILGILLVLIGMIIIYWNIGYSLYKNEFNKEMNSQVNEITSSWEECEVS